MRSQRGDVDFFPNMRGMPETFISGFKFFCLGSQVRFSISETFISLI
ncbi:hypothetical protein AWB78_07730 [Caballeronia calidae]|uniref:Uncharacterized protein n=1 Tax=Caballeronia calidae TaxID=1777139 RepID=A0A158EG30_9BURK|nr:hypothetical protein AWB78_07730 [Caballeronia calidae]